LARDTSPEDGSDILVIVPVVDQDRTNGMKHDDGVLAKACDVADNSLTTLPEGKVVAVTLVAVDDDVAFTGVGIGKD
jgi:hypothetical protein